jgi:hypothetical protein
MAVIPVCTLKGIKLSLRISCEMNKESYILVRGKFIRKTFVRYKGTLGDTSSSIVVVGVMLEDAMPMLYGDSSRFQMHPRKRDLTMEVGKSKELSLRLSVTLIWSWSPCGILKSKGKGNY